MNKGKAGAVFIVLLACGLSTQAFAQGKEPKFNSNADDIKKIGNLLEEFRQDIIRKDGNALTKLMLHPNVLFHSIDNQESLDNARKLNAQFDGIGPSALDGFVTLLATSKERAPGSSSSSSGRLVCRLVRCPGCCNYVSKTEGGTRM